MAQHRLRTPRLGDEDAQSRQSRPGRGRRQSGVEDEWARGIDQMVAHRLRPEHRAALAAQRLGERGRHHHVGRAGKTRLVEQTAPARAPHPQPVRFVDQEHRPVLAADLMQPAQRGQGPVGAEHRVGDHQGPLLATAGQRRRHRVGIPVRGDHDPRPRQPAGVDQGGMARGIGHHQRSAAGQGGHRGEVGGVARREHQGGFGTDESGQLGLQFLMEHGVPGDQTRAGRTRTPQAQCVYPRLDHGRMSRQTEVVVGRQVQHAGLRAGCRRPGPQRPAKTRLLPLPTGDLQPGQRGGVGAGCHARAHR